MDSQLIALYAALSSRQSYKRRDDEKRSHRKKLRLVAQLAASTSVLKGPRLSNCCRNRAAALGMLQLMPDRNFNRMFRMDRAAFYGLVAKVSWYTVLFDDKVIIVLWVQLQSHLKTDEEMAKRSSGSPVYVELRVAACLRWLAGASYLDVGELFAIDSFTLLHQITPVLEALNEALTITFPFDDLESLRQLERGFYETSRGRVRGCVAAGDGVAISCRMPTVQEAGRARKTFMNRKGKFALVVQAFVDSTTRFLFVSANHAGSTHDSVAFAGTSLAAHIENGRLPSDFYVIGDEAYVASEQFLTPWSGRNLSVEQDAFNYHLSLMRQVVERAFGITFKRWGIFWKPLECSMSKWPLIVTVTFKLHNYCLERRSDLPELTDEELHSANRALEQSAPHILSETFPGQGRRRDLETCPKRTDITTDLACQGFIRPGHSRQSHIS